MAVDAEARSVRRRRTGHRLMAWAYEAWAVVVTAAASVIALAHIAQSPWEATFLYNADSVVLPMVEKSLAQGEPFDWVFSSQNFFFPEGLFFAVSTAFTDSPQVALYANACLNILVLYVLLRVIAHQLTRGSGHRFVEISIALACTILFVVYSLLEPTASVNRSSTATLYLMTTYYYGVIVAGLAMVCLTLWVTRSFSAEPWGRRRVWIYIALAATISALTVFSDPLYLAQVLAPLVLCLVFVAVSRRASWKRVGLLLLPSIGGSALGFSLRSVFANLFASNLTSYYSPDNVPISITVLQESFTELTSTTSGSLKLLLLAAVLALTLSLLIYAVFDSFRRKNRRRMSTVGFFIVVFVSVSSISLFAGHILTGAITTRYLTPIYIFPLLTLVYVGVHILRRLLVEVEHPALRRDLVRLSTGIAVAATIVIVVVATMKLPAVARSASGATYAGAECFNDFVGDSGRDGVGSFWSVRNLDVYGSSTGEILQVNPDLTVYAWMNNIAPYEGKTFSFVISDSSPQLPPESLIPLGEPAALISCPDYDIYDYAGTEGEKILNRIVGESADKLLASTLR